MKQEIFRGVATALVTPMTAEDKVDYDRLRALLEEQIAGGVDALVVCGTTGESPALSHEEHVKVIEESVKTVAGRVPVIAGTGSNDTAYALELSKEAERLGADALLMVTPYYNKTSQRGLIAHYTYVADRVHTPIILYNVPSRTGVNIKPETYAALAELPNIAAAKEANGDIAALAVTRHLCGENLHIYSGNDDQIVPVLSLGGKGVISVLSNVAPKQTHEICAAYFAGDTARAASLQIRYISLIRALFSDVNPIPVKEAMNLLGMAVGPCRLPLVPMSETGRAALANALKEVGLLH